MVKKYIREWKSGLLVLSQEGWLISPLFNPEKRWEIAWIGQLKHERNLYYIIQPISCQRLTAPEFGRTIHQQGNRYFPWETAYRAKGSYCQEVFPCIRIRCTLFSNFIFSCNFSPFFVAVFVSLLSNTFIWSLLKEFVKDIQCSTRRRFPALYSEARKATDMMEKRNKHTVRVIRLQDLCQVHDSMLHVLLKPLDGSW